MISKSNGYLWEPPVLRGGETIMFEDHSGATRIGVCEDVQTNYQKQVAVHTYSILKEGCSRFVHIRGEQIIEICDPVDSVALYHKRGVAQGDSHGR